MIICEELAVVKRLSLFGKVSKVSLCFTRICSAVSAVVFVEGGALVTFALPLSVSAAVARRPPGLGEKPYYVEEVIGRSYDALASCGFTAAHCTNCCLDRVTYTHVYCFCKGQSLWSERERENGRRRGEGRGDRGQREEISM